MRLEIEDAASGTLTLEQLIQQLEKCSADKQVIFGPGYCGPKSDYAVKRFTGGIMLEFGITHRDHHPHLRPKKYLVPETTVGEYVEFLKSIPGTTREWWKGGTEKFTLQHLCYIGLNGEVPTAVVGVFEGSSSVTVISVAKWE